ncbi:MAG: hypothetical protein P8P83_01745 [Rickettsiaceae bacterium]|nr:hypothetical protein [Rickettsiaceae bacterium]
MQNWDFLTGVEAMTPKDQRAITRDWEELVPYMKRLNSKPMGLYRRLGPILITIYLVKNRSATNYKPHLCCQTLMCTNPFIGYMTLQLSSAVPGGASYISLHTHNADYKKAFAALESQATFQLKQEITLREVVAAYRNYILEEDCNFSSEIYDQALIPAWAGEHELAKESLEWAIEHQDKVLPWNMMRFHNLKDGNEWISDLRKKIANPELLRETVKSEVKRHKLEKIPFLNLVDAPYQE